jgi:RsiW-degrading membrane proteinase PrsW (M82 family)
MIPIHVGLPSFLLVLSFLLKLSIGRAVDRVLVIKSGFELPVDMAFLGTSFIVAFAISSPQNAHFGIACLMGFLVLVVLVVLCWRQSVSCFEANKLWQSLVCFALGAVISLSVLAASIRLLSGV